MGEKKILTEEMIEERLSKMRLPEIRFIDPMRLAQWNLETCCEMVDSAISKKTIERAIDAGDLEAFKAGKIVTVEPIKFLTWYKRFKR